MADCEHGCPVCWLRESRTSLGSWLFAHMPVAWRHRRLMRAAMTRRRRWQNHQATAFIPGLMANPRNDAALRRMMRELETGRRAVVVQAMMNAFPREGAKGA